MRSTLQTILAALVINALLLAAVAIAADRLIISSRGLRFDFYPHIVGGRAVWRGENPYMPEVTQQIQMGMFGRILPPDADQQNMAYPAYASVVLAPVIMLPDKTAIALWMAIQFVAVLWTPVIWMQILGWRPAPVLAALLALSLLFGFRYPMDLFVLGQFSGTVLMAVSLGFLALLRGRDRLAGGILCLATIPPTIGAPIAIAILTAYGLRGRWRGLLTFAAGMLVLNLISFALVGNWIPDYLNILRAYSDYAEVAWAVDIIGILPLKILFVGGLLALSVWMLRRFLFGARHISISPQQTALGIDTEPNVGETGRSPVQDDTAVDLVVAVLIVSLLLLIQTGGYYLVLLIPAIVACLQRAEIWRQTRSQHGSSLPLIPALIWVSCALIIGSAWLYPRGPETNLSTLLLPLHVLATWCAVNYRQWVLLRY